MSLYERVKSALRAGNSPSVVAATLGVSEPTVEAIKRLVDATSEAPVTTKVADCSITLAPDWHPLAHIDNFILACGWTYEPEGFVPPLKWQEPIRLQYGGGRHWRREHAASFCIVYHERAGIPIPLP